MYISRVEVDSNNRKKIKDLTCTDAYHNWVERSFPTEISDKIRTRKLWRLDTIKNIDYLIVISKNKPDLKLLELYGVEGSAETKIYDSFLNSLVKGMKMRFRVVLNPVRILSKGKGNRGNTKPIYNVEGQANYLLERSEKNGFFLKHDDFFIIERGISILKKTNRKYVRLNKVVYEGVLTISDVETFKKALASGIGRHKAYGFGMMTAIPLED